MNAHVHPIFRDILEAHAVPTPETRLADMARTIDEQAELIRRQSAAIDRMKESRKTTLFALVELLYYVREKDFATANGEVPEIVRAAARVAVAGGYMDESYLTEVGL